MANDRPGETTTGIALADRSARALPILLWALPLGATLATTPAIVRGLGAEAYGAYTIAMAVAVFAILPSPMAAVARFRASAAEGANLDRLGWRIGLLLLAGVLLNIVSIGAPAVLVTLRALLPAPLLQALVLFSLALLILSSALSQLLLALLHAQGRWSRGAVLSILTSLAAPIIAMGLAMSGAGWPAVILGQASTLFCGFVALLIVHRRLPSDEPSAVTPAAAPSTMAGFMARTALAGAIGSFIAIGERWLIGARFGTETAGFFALAMSLALLIHAFVLAINIRLPGLLADGRIRAGRAGLITVYDRTIRISALAACLALSLVLVRGEAFIHVWLGAEIGARVHPFLNGLAVSNFAMAVLVPAWMFAETTGNERVNVALMLALLVGWATAIILLLSVSGPQAVVIGRLAALVVVPIAIVLVERRVLGAFRFELWSGLIPRLAFAVLAAVMASLLMPQQGVTGLVLGGASATLAYGAATWMMGLWRLEDLQARGP